VPKILDGEIEAYIHGRAVAAAGNDRFLEYIVPDGLGIGDPGARSDPPQGGGDQGDYRDGYEQALGIGHALNSS
jgi:hypothetical protein